MCLNAFGAEMGRVLGVIELNLTFLSSEFHERRTVWDFLALKDDTCETCVDFVPHQELKIMISRPLSLSFVEVQRSVHQNNPPF